VALGLATASGAPSQYHWHRRSRSELLTDALQHSQRAIDLAPRDPDPYYTVALITHLLPGETARAEAALRHCLVLNPSYAPAHGLLAIVRTVQGLCAGSRRALRPRLCAEPARAAARHLALGRGLGRTGTG